MNRSKKSNKEYWDNVSAKRKIHRLHQREFKKSMQYLKESTEEAVLNRLRRLT